MGPRRYGRTSITLVPSSAVGVFDAMGDGGDGSASETVGSSFHMGDPLENESAHVPIMDGFDFSSSTSAWKPDSKPIAAPGERERARGRESERESPGTWAWKLPTEDSKPPLVREREDY